MSEPQSASTKVTRVRVCLAAVQDGKIVLVPHYDTDVGPVQWCIPGGRVGFAEGLKEAAVREFEEETGLRVRVGDLLDVTEVILPERPYHSITISFRGHVLGGQEKAEPHHRYGRRMPRWFSVQELEALQYHPRRAVEKALCVQPEGH